MGVTKTLITPGSGPKPNIGDEISVHYTGWLRDPSAPEQKGSVFDNSRTRTPPRPLQFELGAGRVIKGWDEGMAQLQEGETARLDITSDYGYGAKGYPGLIPGHADLIFEVELVKAKV